MRTLQVELDQRSYPILIGSGILGSLGQLVGKRMRPAKAAVISDTTVEELYGQIAAESLRQAGFTPSVLTVEPGEGSKSLECAARLYDQLAEMRLERTCPVIALGGGAVGDLAGFVAATWLRGVPLVQVPTTLVADIDASVGGKTAVNHPAGKNLVGAFYQPRIVVIDVACLRTLDERDMRAGLAESVKHGVIADAAFFAWHQQNAQRILVHDEDVLAELVWRNCQIKSNVVARDEREAGLRQILNFGHTIGHAVESECAFQLRHGECVALGMVAANQIAVGRGLLETGTAGRIAELLSKFGLPLCLPRDIPLEALVPWMQRDKKVSGGRVRFVLARQIGQVITADDVSESELLEAIALIQP